MQQKEINILWLLQIHNYFYQQNQKESIKITFKNNKFTRYITPTAPEQTPLKRLHQFHNRNQVHLLTLSCIPIICYSKAQQASLVESEIISWQNWNYMPYHTINHHISQDPHTTSHYKPRRPWLLLKWLFWPKPWHYYHLPEVLQKSLNILIQQFELFSVLTLDRNRIYMLTYSVVKFTYYLAAPLSSLSRGQPHSPDVNHCFCCFLTERSLGISS